jgi:hypothetical protein
MYRVAADGLSATVLTECASVSCWIRTRDLNRRALPTAVQSELNDFSDVPICLQEIIKLLQREMDSDNNEETSGQRDESLFVCPRVHKAHSRHQ